MISAIAFASNFTIRRDGSDVVIESASHRVTFGGDVAAFVAEWFPRVHAGEIASVTFPKRGGGK